MDCISGGLALRSLVVGGAEYRTGAAEMVDEDENAKFEGAGGGGGGGGGGDD